MMIDMMIAVKCPKDELFAFCMENMLKIISDYQNIPMPIYQTSIPFCQFDFEQQSQLYQEFYRHLRPCRTPIRPLIYDMVLDYVKNNNPDIPVRSENRLYLTALRKAAEHYVHEFVKLFSMNASQRMAGLDNFEKRIMEYIFSDQTLIDYLKSIGCLEVTIINSPPEYCSSIAMGPSDIYMQELWNLKKILKTIDDIKTKAGNQGPERYAYCGEYVYRNALYLEPQNCVSMPGFGKGPHLSENSYNRLSDNIKDAIERDDVASFMINMQIYGKKVCDTLLNILVMKSKTRILNELMHKYPAKCKDVVFLLISGNFSPKTLVLLKTIEEMHPGTVKGTLDKLGQNLLWYAFAKTNGFGKLEQFLLSSGCDTENQMQNLSYRRFKELYLQYRQKE